MRGILKFGLAAAFFAMVPAAPAAAEELEPSGGWSLDYADDSCALRRSFGEGEDRVWLEIRQLAPVVPARITVAAADFPKKRRKAVLDRAPTLRFLPAGTEERYNLVAFGEYGEGLQGLAVYALILPPETSAEGGPLQYFRNGEPYAGHSTSSNAIELEGAFERDIVLKTGDLELPFEAMDACMSDLIEHWNVASATAGELAQVPVPRDMTEWARPIMRSFPRGLLRFGGPTVIRARLIVGADGKAEQCRIIEPVVDAAYEERTCGVILTDAEYEPARDVDGDPVRALYIQHIIYVSPAAQRQPTSAR